MSRPAERARVNHAETARLLRARPRMWQVIGNYRAKEGAAKIARDIRAAYQRHSDRGSSPYAPAGEYEAYARMAEEGWEVVARYVGPRIRKDITS